MPLMTPNKIDHAKIFCCYCGELISGRQITTEHLVPISMGGNDSASNKKKCCRSCNHERGNRPLASWISFMEGALRDYWTRPSAQYTSRYLLLAKIENAKYWLHYIETAGTKLYRSAEHFKQKKRSLN